VDAVCRVALIRPCDTNAVPTHSSVSGRIQLVYTYVLLSESDREWYTGSTRDLRNRLKRHAEGHVRSTASRRPLKLIYYEACLSVSDAFRRERFLKTGKSKRFLRNRLAEFLTGLRGNKLERH